MLQKIVNGIAIASGVVSITVVGVAGYVYIRKDAIIENVKSKVMESVVTSWNWWTRWSRIRITFPIIASAIIT